MEAATTEAPPAILHVETDRGGTLLVDGEERETLDPEEPLELDLEPGRHELQVEGDDGTEFWREEVELRGGGTRSVEVALDSEEEVEDSGNERRILTGFTVGAGVAVAAILALFGWVLLGDRMFGFEPDRNGSWGENVVERGGTVVETSRTVAQRGWMMAGHGASTVYSTTNDALAWMGAVNKKPRPEPDRVVTTSDVLVDVISNDRDPEGESMRVVSAGPIPDSAGTVTVVDSSNLSLQPAAGFAGSIDVPYVVADAPGDTAQSHVAFQVPFDTTHRTVARNIEEPQEVHTDSLGSDGDLDSARSL